MCELCDMWGDFPMTPWLVELEGGPFDGRIMTAPPHRCQRGLPSDRIYAVPIPEPVVSLSVTNNTNDLYPSLTRLVYERGDSISEDTHRWPYRYVGTIH